MQRVINYLLLVGFPVLAVLGVLHYGNNMLTVMCIQGPRTAQTIQTSAAAPSCQEQHLQAERQGFSISQSGSQFSVSFNGEPKAVLQGQLRDTSITATAPSFSFGKDENSSNLIGLRATIDRQTNPARLWGVFSFNNCPDIKFVANQQSDTFWAAR